MPRPPAVDAADVVLVPRRRPWGNSGSSKSSAALRRASEAAGWPASGRSTARRRLGTWPEALRHDIQNLGLGDVVEKLRPGHGNHNLFQLTLKLSFSLIFLSLVLRIVLESPAVAGDQSNTLRLLLLVLLHFQILKYKLTQLADCRIRWAVKMHCDIHIYI